MRRLYEGHDSCLFQHRENSGEGQHRSRRRQPTSSGKTCCSHTAPTQGSWGGGAATGRGNRTTVQTGVHLYGRVSVVIPEHAAEAEIKNSDRHLREQRPWVCGLERSGVWLSVDGKGFPRAPCPGPSGLLGGLWEDRSVPPAEAGEGTGGAAVTRRAQRANLHA